MGSVLTAYLRERTIWVSCGLLLVSFLIMLFMLLFLDVWQQYTQFRPVLQLRPDVPGLPCQFRPPVL